MLCSMCCATEAAPRAPRARLDQGYYYGLIGSRIGLPIRAFDWYQRHYYDLG